MEKIVMVIRFSSAFAAAILLPLTDHAEAQTTGNDPELAVAQTEVQTAEIARLYDSLEGRPGWPAGIRESEVDSALARRGIQLAQRRAIIAAVKQDACRLPGMAPVCRYYGSETIYKVQRLGWAGFPGEVAGAIALPARPPGGDIMTLQMQLLEYGAARNLARLYGDRGLTDAREAELNGSAQAGPEAAKTAGLNTQTSVWFSCRTHQRTLPGTSPLPLTREYRLTTCGTGFGMIFRIVVFGWRFSWEFDLLLTHSRFARRVVSVWWPTGADPFICANSIIGWSGNLKCNNYSWTSPVSFNTGSFVNSSPASVVSHGSATRLGQGFGVTITHQ